MAPFGRNPWGLKVLLHLLAFGCIPLTNRLGWQLGRRRWFAFVVGLLTALLPDLYVYSSYVLSEAPDVFFALLYCTLLISALETLSPSWIVAAALAGSFTVLVRSENLVALAIGLAFLLMRIIWLRRTAALPSAAAEVGQPKPSAKLWHFGLAVLIAAVPLLAWSAHNARVYGFFGISDYGGEILYDGWIYYGESSRLAITSQDSPAVQAIRAAYKPRSADGSPVPTGWEIYYSLLAHGYNSEQSFGLLGQAAIDSIRNDLSLAGRILMIKVRDGFEPNPFIPGTFPLPGEMPQAENLNASYFDKEPLLVPALVPVQQFMNRLMVTWYRGVFTVWFWLGLTMIFIALYRRPPFVWIPLVLIAANSIFLPTIVGMSMWRYVLFGLVLIPIFILSGVQSLAEFILHYWNAFSKRKLSRD